MYGQNTDPGKGWERLMISLLNQIICSPGQGNLRTTSWLYGSLEKVKITEIDRFNQVKVMHGRAMDGGGRDCYF